MRSTPISSSCLVGRVETVRVSAGVARRYPIKSISHPHEVGAGVGDYGTLVAVSVMVGTGVLEGAVVGDGPGVLVGRGVTRLTGIFSLVPA